KHSILYCVQHYYLRIYFNSFGWESIGCGLTNTDIKTKRLNKVLRHAASSWRAPYWKRFGSAQKPSRKPQIRDADNMVGVKMSEKETVYVFRINSNLRKASYDSPGHNQT